MRVNESSFWNFVHPSRPCTLIGSKKTTFIRYITQYILLLVLHRVTWDRNSGRFYPDAVTVTMMMAVVEVAKNSNDIVSFHVIFTKVNQREEKVVKLAFFLRKDLVWSKE
jgi:hypothetical protein